MIKKNTYLIPTDKNGIWLVKSFHLYGGFFKKFSQYGNFIKVSVKQVKLNSLLLKKSKVKSIIILTKYLQTKNDLSWYKYKYNSCVLLKRRLSPIGKELYGPVFYGLKRKKFLYSFSGIL